MIIKDHNNKLHCQYFLLAHRWSQASLSQKVGQILEIEPAAVPEFPNIPAPFKAEIVDLLNFQPQDQIPSVLTLVSNGVEPKEIRQIIGIPNNEPMAFYYLKKVN